MNCLACGALLRGTGECKICGAARDGSPGSRSTEGQAVVGLMERMDPGEKLLGATRGLFVGDGGERAGLHAGAILWRAANVGLTSHRWIVQQVKSNTGAVGASGEIPLRDAADVHAEPAEPPGAARAVRLVVRAPGGRAVRLIAVGRFADGAEAMVRVWRALVRQPGQSEPGGECCAACGREIGRGHGFCPFCGAPRLGTAEQEPRDE